MNATEARGLLAKVQSRLSHEIRTYAPGHSMLEQEQAAALRMLERAHRAGVRMSRREAFSVVWELFETSEDCILGRTPRAFHCHARLVLDRVARPMAHSIRAMQAGH